MMKIIRVNGCHDCGAYAEDVGVCGVRCNHPDTPNYYNVTEYYYSKTLPDNCPLEEINVEHLIALAKAIDE